MFQGVVEDDTGSFPERCEMAEQEFRSASGRRIYAHGCLFCLWAEKDKLGQCPDIGYVYPQPAPVSYMDRADRSNGMVQKEQIQK